MHVSLRAALAALAVSGLACAGNKANDDVGAARDSTSAGAVSADSTTNQSQSGVTDSSGSSTLGKGVEQTRPDQGQPVTSKGDTVNTGIDSTTTNRTGMDSTSMNHGGMDSTGMNHSGMDSTSMNQSGMDSTGSDSSTAR
jgi:hypothetical protein